MNLQQETIRGILWSGGTSAVTTALNFVTVAVLAHLLSPGDFGLMGMVLAVIGFVTLVGDLGLGSAVIQTKDLTPSHCSTFFYLNVLLGTLLSVIVYVLGPPLALFFGRSELTPLVRSISFILVFLTCGSTFRTLLQRDMKFKNLAVVDMIGTLAYGIVSIVLGFKSFGVYSLLGGFAARQFIELAVLWTLVRYKPVPVFRPKEILHLVRFGTYVLGERLLNYGNRNLDNILIGKILGADALGYYSLAYQLMFVPTSKISQVIGKVTYPVFSKIQDDDERMRRGYLAMIRYVSLIAFPLMMTVFVVAPEFIPSIYGIAWKPSILILQIFCLVGIVESVGSTVGGVLYAKGRADIAFKYNIINLLVVCGAIIAGLSYGIVGVAIALAVVSVFLGYLWHGKTNALIHLSWKSFFQSLEFSLLLSGVLLITTFIFRELLGLTILGRDGLGILLIVSAFALLVYFATIAVFKKSILSEIKHLLVTAMQ